MYITVSRSGKIYADMGQILNLRPGDMFSFWEERVAWYTRSRSIIYFGCVWCLINIRDYPEA